MSVLTSAPLIAYRNLASGLSPVASSADASFPDDNLGNSLLESSVWHSASDVISSVTVDINLGSNLSIDIIALLGFNGSNGSVRTPLLSTHSDLSSPNYNPGSGSVFDLTYTHDVDDTPSYGRHLIVLPGQTITSRYGRLTLTDTTSSDNQLKGSVLWLGPAWQFPQGYDISTEPLGNYSGIPGVERRLRGWKLIVKALSEQDAVSLESIVNTRLRTGRLILIPHPTLPSLLHEALYCTITSYKRSYLPIISSTPWQVEIEFWEVED